MSSPPVASAPSGTWLPALPQALHALLVFVRFLIGSQRQLAQQVTDRLMRRVGRVRVTHQRVHVTEAPADSTQRFRQQQITMMHIQPGKPTQNAYIERYNRTVRHEWLKMHAFQSIEHAQHLATEWLWLHNNERPNTAIGGIPPERMIMAA